MAKATVKTAPETETTEASNGSVAKINIGQNFTVNLAEVYRDPALNTRHFIDDDEALESFAKTIKSTEGLLQPIGVTPTPESRKGEHDYPYELVYGYRRCRALEFLAEKYDETFWIEQIPAVLREDLSAGKRHIHQLIENLQRRDLQPMEIAIALQSALKDESIGMSQKELAEQIGWSDSTVSNYLRVARLEPEVQDLVLTYKEAKEGEEKKQLLSWSNAKIIAGYKLPKEQQIEAAKMGCGLEVADFAKAMAEAYGEKKDGAAEKDTATGEEATKGDVQKAHKTIRSTELENKYLPKLEEMAKNEKNKAEKSKLDARIDTIKWTLNIQGTELGTTLQPWEAELQQKKAEEEAKEEVDRQRKKYIRLCTQAIKKTLAANVEPGERKPTFPECLEQIRVSIQADMKKAKDGGAADNTMPQGFVIDDVDAFLQEVAADHADNAKKDAEKKKVNAEKKAKEAEEAKKKEEAEAAAKAGKTETSDPHQEAAANIKDAGVPVAV